MFTPLFWFFAALTLLFGVGVVVNRNPVASALCLVVSFMGLAALFVGLDAYLIGVLQVLVYAGAVMVLFLFIIMLLDLKAEKRRSFNALGVIGGGLVAVGFASQLIFTLANFEGGRQQFAPLRSPAIREQALANSQVTMSAATGAEVVQPSASVAPQRYGNIDDVRQIGWAIFSGYNLPLQVVGVLLLVATVGVVVLSKRQLQ